MNSISTTQSVEGIRAALLRQQSDKDMEVYNEVAGHFWPIVGTANQIAYMAIDDAVESMKADGMFKQKQKQKAQKALEEYHKYELAAYNHYMLIGEEKYALWQDVIGRAAEALQPDVMKLYFSIKNVMDKERATHSATLAHIQTALALVTMSTLIFDQMMKRFSKYTTIDLQRTFGGGRLTAVERNWMEVGDITGKQLIQQVNLRDNEQCILGINVILTKFGSKDFLNDAAEIALRLNPNAIKNDEDRQAILNDESLWEDEK